MADEYRMPESWSFDWLCAFWNNRFCTPRSLGRPKSFQLLLAWYLYTVVSRGSTPSLILLFTGSGLKLTLFLRHWSASEILSNASGCPDGYFLYALKCAHDYWYVQNFRDYIPDLSLKSRGNVEEEERRGREGREETEDWAKICAKMHRLHVRNHNFLEGLFPPQTPVHRGLWPLSTPIPKPLPRNSCVRLWVSWPLVYITK